MDLQTVVTKLNPNHFQHYKTFQDFISDIRLIFSNCVIYNAVSFNVLLLLFATFYQSDSRVKNRANYKFTCNLAFCNLGFTIGKTLGVQSQTFQNRFIFWENPILR